MLAWRAAMALCSSAEAALPGTQHTAESWKRCVGRCDSRTGRPSTRVAIVDDVRNTLQENHRKTVNEITCDLDAAPSTVFKVIKKDLKMKKLAPKLISHVLTEEHKWHRVQYSQNNLERV